MTEIVNKTNGMKMMAAACCLFCLAPTIGIINAALGAINVDFPNVSAAEMSYLTNVAALANILAGFIVSFAGGKKIKFRTLTIICLIVYTVCGTMPFFFTGATPFWLFLASRFLLGLGLGCFFPIANTVVTLTYRDEQQRSKMMGVGNAFFNVGSVIATFGGGVLCAIAWQYTFLLYLIGVIALIVVLICFKEPEHLAAADEQKNKKEKVKIPWIVFFVLAVQIIAQIFFQTMWTGLASVMMDASLGEPALIGTVMAVMSVVMIFIALLLGPVANILKKAMLPVLLIVIAIGFALVFFAANSGSVALLWVGCMVYAAGLCLFTAGVPLSLGLYVKPAAVVAAMGFQSVAMNAGAFLASPYMQIATIFVPSIKDVYMINTVGLIALAVIALVVMLRAKKDKTTETE